MEVKIISRESVKPSSPTPQHLRTYKLSLLDQLMPPSHVPMIFFYASTNQISTTNHVDLIAQKLQVLKQSLSDTLTSFYPFAGRVKDDDLCIDCNDEGVSYAEAETNCCLSDVLGQPDGQVLRKLLPQDQRFLASGVGILVAMIQINVFRCGGIAIGTHTLHKIIDGPTSSTFLKAWAANARGSLEPVLPNLMAPTLFPQNNLLPRNTMLGIWPSLIKFGKCVMKRFVFDASAIAAIKAKAASASFVQRPTSVEAISVFIWVRAMAACKTRHGGDSKRRSVLTHLVSLRAKKVSRLSENSIGNLLWVANAECKPEAEIELPSLVGLLRNSLCRIDGNFVENLQGEKGFFNVCECLKELGQVYSDPGTDYFTFSSLCKVGIYEADFGWGKPIWICPGGINGPVFQNLVFLNETSRGGGIEAWVCLDEKEMDILERDSELLALASLDPSPLKLSNEFIAS